MSGVKAIDIYTDGACKGNPGAGAGVLFKRPA
jgi:ribonuclease HI